MDRDELFRNVAELFTDDSDSSSESSDSETDDILFFELEEFAKHSPAPVPKIKCYLDVVSQYSPREFRRNFRVSTHVFATLVGEFSASEHMPIATHGGIKPLSPETHVLTFLWFAGNKCVGRDVAGRFGIGESSFRRIIERVSDFLVRKGREVIRMPSTPLEKREAAEDFERVAGFPGVIGCVDGSYITVKCFAGKLRNTYINRHDGISITLQGMCDARRRFIDACTGFSSKMHDASVWNYSFVSHKVGPLCESGRYHILGDCAYPIKEYLLTPFRGRGALSGRQEHYNKKLSATRVLIENTFALLKGRFGQLLRLQFWGLETASKFVIACCVLNNICIDDGDEGFEAPDDSTTRPADGPQQAASMDIERIKGQQKRERLVSFFSGEINQWN